eukprot:GFKZ01008814.1.p1 GENE.GFKZ01008814.1~~GFKZ01008814.1.p1  ORF type:complete len:1494 (+),score=243.88 GFKZ01008814.1:1413-5894(+)
MAGNRVSEPPAKEQLPDPNATQVSALRPPRMKRKEPLQSSTNPMVLKSIQFSIMSPKEIAAAADIEVNNPRIYEESDRSQTRGGALDPRLGAINKTRTCETCQQNWRDCIGHHGYIRLALPVFHPGYFKVILRTLQMVCKHCSLVLLDPSLRYSYLTKLRTKGVSAKSHIRDALIREVWERSKKVKVCPYCSRANGTVKKVPVMRIMHYPLENKPSHKKKDEDEEEDEFLDKDEDEDLLNVDPAFHAAAKGNPDLRRHIMKAADELNPMRVLHIFEKIPAEDVRLLDMDPVVGRPERMLLQYMPVPPLCIRPTVESGPSSGTNEDDLTIKAAEIVTTSGVIANLLEKGGEANKVFETWDILQQEVARYINSEQPGLPPIQGGGKPIRGISQRLKGKTGRFRGNLSGKRVDFSGRTVISPDPNLRIDQVGVPIYVAKTLTFPERVTTFNMKALRKAILNGPDKHPGANYIEFVDGSKKNLQFVDRQKIARELPKGAIVERHIRDGDIVLFNRQPSLHRISIMAHRVKISPHRTFRFNECVCAPYNADFDGDEMNLHVPQTHEAKTEAIELMGVVNNILTPKNGEPLVAATQDFITASFLVTSKSMFMDRAEFSRVATMMSNGEFSLPIPPPAIIKPMELWTGKQLFTVLVQSAALSAGALTKPSEWESVSYSEAGSLAPSLALLTTEVKEKGFKKGGPSGALHSPVMIPQDSYVCFRGGELVCGQVGKKSLGDGSKPSILYVLARECGNVAAAHAMNRLARFAARWLAESGFSIGIDDVTPAAELLRSKQRLIAEGYEKCDEFIEQLRVGKLQLKPGCSAEETLEAVLNSELSRIREDAGKACIETIDVRTNAALTMALAGSKGSTINMSQMIACVGQQTVSGGRAPDGFFGRALPHFELGLKARSPVAKGFVANSFYSGMVPTEFFMHAQSGREGLTDTAVKTAETGYMQRRLVKALEDLSVQYDWTVRSCNGALVQMMYGDDNLDPLEIEGEDGDAVNFERALQGSICSSKGTTEPMLTPPQLRVCIEELFKDLEADLIAANLLSTAKEDNEGGLKRCLRRSKDFLYKKAKEQEDLESSLGLRRCEVKYFLMNVVAKLRAAAVEPGTAVGAIAAQSVGEPATQMTLKTFHFAGVAAMNITQGVPRLKEIINASKSIATPITEAPLVNEDNEKLARIVKGRVERTTLGEVSLYMKEVYRSNCSYVAVRLDMDSVHRLQLDIDLTEVASRILQHSFSKIRVTADDIVVIRPDKLRIRPHKKGESSRRDTDSALRLGRSQEARKKEMETRPHFLLQTLKHQLGKVPICGISSVHRAVINDKGGQKFELLIESDDLASIMVIPGTDGTKVICNHIMSVEKTLGIEAARRTVYDQIKTTMGSHGLQVASHHLQLLADCMTSRGSVLGITRFGIQKMRSSTLMLASFEMTVDHLFDAAIHSRRDDISGVSERIIMGVPIPIGTGLFKMLRQSAPECLPSLSEKREILLKSTTSKAAGL